MDRCFLMEAISCCDLNGVNEFLSSGGNVNGYFSGLSPLLYAIQCVSRMYFPPFKEPDKNLLCFSKNFSSDDIVLRLISAEADVRVRYPYNLMTPLILALKCKRSNDIVNELIKAGSDINAECADLKTALFYAVEYNCDLFIISELLSKGANVNHVCRLGRTPLIYALIFIRNLEIITILVNAGADVNLTCSMGKTPLMYAVRYNCDKYVVKTLINESMNVNRVCLSGKTALFYAAVYSKDSEIINILVNAGCSIDFICPKGKTPLFYAIELNSVKSIILELIHNGAYVNHSCKLGKTPLFSAVTNSDAEIIMALISAGSDVRLCDSSGQNVLSCLTCCDNCTKDSCTNKYVTDLLIHHGADLTKIDRKGNTIIHLVNCMYIINLAIKCSISIEAKNHCEMTALMDAAFSNNANKVYNLLQLNADPNCSTSDLNTVLHYIDLISSDEVINLLLYHGANLHAVNVHYRTPLDILFERLSNIYFQSFVPGFETIVKYFLLYVSEAGLNDYICDCDNNKIYLCIEECKAELHKMRQLFIKEDLTFYDFCVLKRLYRSNSIDISVDDYKYSLKKIKGLFPIYHDFIIMRIKDNHRKRCKKELLKSLEKLIVKPNISSDVVLNFDCLYHIGFYLDNKQLLNLFLCSN